MASAMLKILSKCNDEHKSSAKVVDGNLILSLPDAVNPIVWRMELGSVKASALEVREGASGHFVLALKTPKGDVHEIAPFPTRAQAVYALMRVSAALQSAEGHIAGTSVASAPSPVYYKESGSSKKWLFALGAILLIIFFIAWVSSSAPVQTETNGNFNSGQTSSTGNSLSGIPQPADEILRGF